MDEKRIIEASKDGFTFRTADAMEAMTFLTERAAHTQVRVVDQMATIPVFPVDTRLDAASYTQHNVTDNTMTNVSGYSREEAFEECCRNVGLLLTTTKGYDSLLLRDTAELGLHDACEVQGRGWNHVRRNHAVHSDVCNGFLQTGSRKATLIEVFGKVTGIASSKYTYLPQEQLLQAFITAGAESNGKLNEFIYAHDLTTACIEFPSDEAKKYSVQRLGMDESQTTLRMYMATSDTRRSSAYVWFVLSDGNRMCSAIGTYQAHKGKSAIVRFSESCLSMFTALSQTVKELLDLENIALTHAESTIREVAKRLGISDKHTASVIREQKAKGISFENGWSAYDGYLFICGIIDLYQPKKQKGRHFGSDQLFENYVKTELKAKIGKQPWNELDSVEHFPPIELLPANSADELLPGQMSLI